MEKFKSSPCLNFVTFPHTSGPKISRAANYPYVRPLTSGRSLITVKSPFYQAVDKAIFVSLPCPGKEGGETRSLMLFCCRQSSVSDRIEQSCGVHTIAQTTGNCSLTGFSLPPLPIPPNTHTHHPLLADALHKSSTRLHHLPSPT